MFHRQLFSALLVLSTSAVFSQQALAQSATRTNTPARPTSPPGSASRAAQSTVALDGYCAVCVIEMKKWIPGKPEYQVTYDGKAYYFPGDEQKQMFLADPAKYVPALGGDCTVCAVNMGQRMAGKLQFPSLYANRLFLFPNEELKQEFRANPTKYADADLALGGKCSVCRIEMNQDVDGNPEIAAFHQGMRYLFPGEDQRKMFLANPAKYAVKPIGTK